MHGYLRPIIIFLCLWCIKSEVCPAWGLRLSLGEYYSNPSSNQNLIIAFNTDYNCLNSYVLFAGQKVSCDVTTLNITQVGYLTFVHKCSIKGLDFQGEQYFKTTYKVVGVADDGQEYPREDITLNLINRNVKETFRILVMGDWGILDDLHRGIYNDIVPQLKSLNVGYSLVVFLGDMAYDLCDVNSQTQKQDTCSKYPEFLKGIQFLTSKTPFLVTLGNHQYGPYHPLAETLSSKSFFTPGDINLYSFELGKIRFQSMNNFKEVKQNDTSQLMSKIDWLKEDYKKKSEEVKWVVPFSHYPFYCKQYANDTGCVKGDYEAVMQPLVDYMNDYEIKLYLGAHIHLFRRSYPIDRKGQKINTTIKVQGNTRIFENPEGPTYIIQGSAGNNYYVQIGQFPLQDYTDAQAVNTGFSILTVYGDRDRLQNDHYRGSDSTIADSFAIDLVNMAWLKYTLLGIGCLVLVLGLVALYCYKKRANKYPRMPSIHDRLVQTT